MCHFRFASVKISSKVLSTIAFWILLGLGFIIRLYQFLSGKSLAFDEASLSENILKRGYYALLYPLDYDQVAPILFLWIERFLIDVFGPSDWSLRLFPFLASLAALPLIYYIFKRLIDNRLVIALAFTVVAFNPMAIYYASEVKQYSTDLFAFSLILAGYLYFIRHPSNLRSLLLILIGTVAIWLSNPSVVVLFIVGIHLLYTQRLKLKSWIPPLIWGAVFIVYYAFFIYDHPTQGMMENFWRDSFMPINILGIEFWNWQQVTWSQIMRGNLGASDKFLMPVLFAGLMVFSIVKMVQHRNWQVMWFSVGPIMVHLVLSSLWLYPFYGRIILYLLPCFAILLTFGVCTYVLQWKNSQLQMAGIVIVITAFLYFPLRASVFLPYKNEEFKESWSFIEEHYESHQRIYLYYSARKVYEIYKQAGFIKIDAPIIFGNKHRDENDKYRSELDLLQGEVWLVFYHVYPFDETNNEQVFMLAYLDSIGSRIKGFETVGSASYLYVLPDSIPKN